MFLKAISICFLCSFLVAGSLKVNDKFTSFSLPDQFDRIHTIKQNISKIIVTFESDSLKLINDFLIRQNYGFLHDHHTVLISDISNKPSIITKMFILPKMKDYKHTILLIYDDKGENFLKQNHKSTIYDLEDGLVKNISYISTQKQLEEIFNHE